MTAREGRGGIAALILVGFLFAGWAVAVKSPLFAVRDVRVQGNVHLSEAEVEALAGVADGANLLTIGLGRVAASLRSDPWVRRATAARDLPGTLVITVEERQQAGWVGDPAGGVIVSADGVALARRSAPRRLPTIGRATHVVEPGEELTSLRGQVEVVASLAPRVRREVERVEVRGPEIVVRLRSGVDVMLGSPHDLREKAAALDSILRWAGEREVALAYIDVRAPATPAVKPATSA